MMRDAMTVGGTAAAGVALTAVALSMLATAATAQLQLTPQPQSPPAEEIRQRRAEAAGREEGRAEERPAEIDRHARRPQSDARQAEAAPPDDPNVDLAYGAYQRGAYGEAFRIATQRAQETRRSEGDDAARRTLCQRPGRQPRRQESRRLVQAGRRSRRSRGDVRAGDDAHGRPRRARQPRGSREAAGIRRPARQRAGRLQSRAAEHRGTDLSAGPAAAPPNCSVRRRMPATRRRNTRWRRSTRRAAASRRTWPKRRGC